MKLYKISYRMKEKRWDERYLIESKSVIKSIFNINLSKAVFDGYLVTFGATTRHELTTSLIIDLCKVLVAPEDSCSDSAVKLTSGFILLVLHVSASFPDILEDFNSIDDNVVLSIDDKLLGV